MIFKKIKNGLRHFLRYFGYDIIKVIRTPFLQTEYKIQVGKFILTLPVTNPLIKTYLEQPDFAAEIGRLVNCVYQKYPKLVFFDIGANTGDTVAIVKSAKDIPVISIEGDNFSFGFLVRNIAQFKNVKAINTFLGEKDETIAVDLTKKGWNTTIIPTSESKDKIEIKTIETVLQNLAESLANIKILKIDTEGFDTKIIRGGLHFIGFAKPVIYFEYNRENMAAINEQGLDTLLKLKDIGYNKVLFYDDRGRYILHTTLSNSEVINDLHDYAIGKHGLIYYYNICLFHEIDNDLAANQIDRETSFRNQSQ